MGLIRDAIKNIREGIHENIKPTKTDEPKQDNHPVKVDSHEIETKGQTHHAEKVDHHHHQDVESKGQTSTVEAVPELDEEQKKQAKKFKRMKIIAIYGLISSIIALANAIDTQEKNGLIVANIVVTFVSALLIFSEYFYLKKTGQEMSLNSRYRIHFLVLLLNLAGVAICIALLVTLGAQYGYIVTLIFHVLIVLLNVYFFCKGNK